ncbi:MAG: hypothetical protein MHM6MM_005979 [Cercozoa sp. M6MM]
MMLLRRARLRLARHLSAEVAMATSVSDETLPVQRKRAAAKPFESFQSLEAESAEDAYGHAPLEKRVARAIHASNYVASLYDNDNDLYRLALMGERLLLFCAGRNAVALRALGTQMPWFAQEKLCISKSDSPKLEDNKDNEDDKADEVDIDIVSFLDENDVSELRMLAIPGVMLREAWNARKLALSAAELAGERFFDLALDDGGLSKILGDEVDSVAPDKVMAVNPDTAGQTVKLAHDAASSAVRDAISLGDSWVACMTAREVRQRTEQKYQELQNTMLLAGGDNAFDLLWHNFVNSCTRLFVEGVGQQQVSPMAFQHLQHYLQLTAPYALIAQEMARHADFDEVVDFLAEQDPALEGLRKLFEGRSVRLESRVLVCIPETDQMQEEHDDQLDAEEEEEEDEEEEEEEEGASPPTSVHRTGFPFLALVGPRAANWQSVALSTFLEMSRRSLPANWTRAQRMLALERPTVRAERLRAAALDIPSLMAVQEQMASDAQIVLGDVHKVKRYLPSSMWPLAAHNAELRVWPLQFGPYTALTYLKDGELTVMSIEKRSKTTNILRPDYTSLLMSSMTILAQHTFARRMRRVPCQPNYYTLQRRSTPLKQAIQQTAMALEAASEETRNAVLHLAACESGDPEESVDPRQLQMARDFAASVPRLQAMVELLRRRDPLAFDELSDPLVSVPLFGTAEHVLCLKFDHTVTTKTVFGNFVPVFKRSSNRELCDVFIASMLRLAARDAMASILGAE